MSKKGSYLRGEKWYHLMRDINEKDGISKKLKEDSEKMKDVNIYLEANKPKTSKKEK